jgi:hypothetical protein
VFNREFFRTYLKVITLLARVVGVLFLIASPVMALTAFMAVEHRVLYLLCALGTALAGLALVVSRPLTIETIAMADNLGKTKTSRLRQNRE